LLTIGGILLGIALWLVWPWLRAHPQWQMAVTMLTVGNLGMLLGWWADAGFGPIIRDGVCLCGCPKSSMGAGLFERFSTMHVGMMLAGFPLMLWLQDPAQSLFRSLSGRWLHALWITVGMGVGMWFAAGVLALLPLIQAQTQFYLTYLGMCLGMMLGMMAFCLIWEWATGYWTRSSFVTARPAVARYQANY
jgi:P-type Cu+ transporter